eukprot:gene15966-21666_t
MSEELRKYVAEAVVEFDTLSVDQKLKAKKDLEELNLKVEELYQRIEHRMEKLLLLNAPQQEKSIDKSPMIYLSPSESVEHSLAGLQIQVFQPQDGYRACKSEPFDIENKTEEDFNAMITPLFQELCGHEANGIGFYNSEDKLWLQEPHHFDQPTFEYGGLCDPIYQRQVLFILEGKIVNIAGNDPLTAMLSYMACRIHKGKDPNPKGLLYNHKEWMHFDYESSMLLKLTTGNWSDHGSFEFLSNCISLVKSTLLDPLTEAIVHHIFKKLNVEPSSNEPFLGRGIDGHVFRVGIVGGSQEQYAIKISLKKSLQEEFAIISGLYLQVPDLVVKPVDNAVVDFICSNGTICGAYLMAEIGNKFDQRKKNTAIKLLTQLHESAFVHGDPRFPNILQFADDKLKFIDFRNAGDGVRASPKTRIKDLQILLTSLYMKNTPEDERESLMMSRQ